jgi:hypothetical protein
VFEVKLSGIKWNITVTKAEWPKKLVWMGKAYGLKTIHEWEFQEQEGKTLAANKVSRKARVRRSGQYL